MSRYTSATDADRRAMLERVGIGAIEDLFADVPPEVRLDRPLDLPAIVDTMLSRSEWLTPYTPYQPEVSQGTLQAMFEYQTAISELTALPVSNASVYEGPSAVASAGYLAKLVNGKQRFVVSRGVHPHSRET